MASMPVVSLIPIFLRAPLLLVPRVRGPVTSRLHVTGPSIGCVLLKFVRTRMLAYAMSALLSEADIERGNRHFR